MDEVQIAQDRQGQGRGDLFQLHLLLSSVLFLSLVTEYTAMYLLDTVHHCMQVCRLCLQIGFHLFKELYFSLNFNF